MGAFPPMREAAGDRGKSIFVFSLCLLFMETFFLSHGSPRLLMNEMPVRLFLESWKARVFPEVPKAILLVSAHWDTAEPSVTQIDGPNDSIHDFNGFPKHIYELQYPAPGMPELAKRVKELLRNSGFDTVSEDKTRGLDHGAWVPLMLMYPEANIPVCQLSVQTTKDGTHHYNMGKALAPLREEGILIIGSGTATHNLMKQGPDDAPPPSWAVDFDKWLTESLLNRRYEDVNHYEEKAPNGKLAHPEPDHFYPLHVALGAAGPNAVAELIHQSWGSSSISYSSYKFKAA